MSNGLYFLIEGNDVVPCRKLLYALTDMGLLTTKVLWGNQGDSLVIGVYGPPEFQQKILHAFRQFTQIPNSEYEVNR